MSAEVAPEMDLKQILEDHLKWLRGEGVARANLTDANLTRANLTRANLTRAYLAGANLTRANLTRANLAGANLAGANLTDAYLAGANLTRANLTRANLAGANLTRAYLADANLTDANLARAYLAGANLTRANLTDANLARAYLTDANLTGAYLADANLAGANLAGANKRALSQTIITPEGDLIAWKRAGDHIVKLKVPAEARRSNATGRKCRAEWVEVLEIHPPAEVAVTEQHGPRTEYRVGATVKADSWDEDRFNECSHGIHFFLTKAEAEDWR